MRSKVEQIFSSIFSSKFTAFCSMLLTLCFLFFAIISSLSAQEKENAEFKLAVGLYNDGMYDLAVEQFKNFINAYPNTSNGIEARFYLGQTQMKLKRYDEARVTFQNFALSYVEHPKAPEAWVNVGDAFLALGNEREAASAYERVKVFHPKSQLVPEALLKAGKLYRQIGDRENAKRNFRTIIQDYSMSATVLQARLEISEMYAEEGQIELAERESRRVAESDAPAEVKASALFSLGKLQTTISLFDDAEQTFKSIITNYKKTKVSTAAMFELGKLVAGKGNLNEAYEYFKNVSSSEIADDSLKGKALFEIGRIYVRQKNYSNAVKSFNKLLNNFPKNSLVPQAILESGRASLANEEYKEALKYSKELIVRHDSHFIPQALMLASDAAIGLHNHTDAVQYLTSFIDNYSQDPSAPTIMLKLAYYYENNMQDYRKALNTYDHLSQKYPRVTNIVNALIGLARCQENIGDYNGTLKTYHEILNQYPACDQFEEIRQKIEYLTNHKLKDRDSGIEKLAHLMGEVLVEKSRANLSFKLGEIYFNDLKDYKSAIIQFENAISNDLEEDKLVDALYYKARSYHLLYEVNLATLQDVKSAYEFFLKKYPNSQRSEDASFFNYQLKIKSKNPEEIISIARTYLNENPKSMYCDQVLFDLAIATIKTGGIADALPILKRLITEFPKSSLIPDALLEQGNIYLQLNQRDSAIIAWQKTISLRSNKPATLLAVWNLIDLYKQNKNFQEAINLCNRITTEFFYSSFAEKTLALLPELYMANNEYDRAIQIYEEMLEEQGKSLLQKEVNPNLFYNIAYAYEKAGEREKAQKYYNRYLIENRRGTYASKCFYSLGAFARMQGRLMNASSYFKQASALSDVDSTNQDIADLLFQTEQYQEAAKIYFELVKTTDSIDVKQYYQSRGIVAMLRMDKLIEAQKLISDFDKNYRKNKSLKAELEYEKALVYYRKQDYTTAKKIFENIVSDYGNTRFEPWGHYYLGKILEVSNKLDDASKKYEFIIKKFPDSDVMPRVLLSLGNMHFNVERFEEAIRYYQQITKSPEKAGDILPYALNNLIEAYESLKMYDDALKTTRDYIEKFPNDENIIDKKIKLGTLYTKIGYYDQAVLYLQNLIPEAGSLLEAELRYDIGEAYFYKGDYQQAILEFLKVPYLVTKQGKVNWTATSLYMAGQSYEKISKFDEAIGMYQQIIDRPNIESTFKAAARKEIDRVKSIIKKE